MATERLSRLEVVDENGRAYTRWGVHVELSYQDHGRTLKIFVADNPEAPHKPASGWSKRGQTDGD